MNKLRLSASFASPIQPHVKDKQLSEAEKQLPTSGGAAVISSLPMRTYDIGQKDRIYRDKTRLSMCTVKTQSLEILVFRFTVILPPTKMQGAYSTNKELMNFNPSLTAAQSWTGPMMIGGDFSWPLKDLPVWTILQHNGWTESRIFSKVPPHE